MSRMTRCFTCVMGVCCALPSVAWGLINLELRPVMQTAKPGDEVRIGLYVVSDNEGDQLMSSAQVVLGWNPTFLRLLGNDNAGAVPLLASGFPANDPYGINEVVPPQDGTGLYLAFAPLGVPVAATPMGTLLTTIRFQALALTPATVVAILPPVAHTFIHDGTIPGLDVTGTLGAATVRIVQPCSPTVGDVNGDAHITFADVSAALDVYLGLDTTPSHMLAADANCDNFANGRDIQPLVDYILLWL